MTPPPVGLPWRVVAALLGGVAVLAVLAVEVTPAGSEVATVWPATALAVVAVVLTPRRQWPPVVCGAAAAFLLADLALQRSAAVAVSHTVVETLSVLAAALLLTRGGTVRAELVDQEDTVRLVLAAALNGGVVLLTGLLASQVGVPGTRVEEMARSALAAGLAHAAALVVVVPLALTRPQRRSSGRVELGAQVALLVVAAGLVFLTGASPALVSAPVLLLAWAAVRFELRLATLELAGFAVFVSAVTLLGLGPLAPTADDPALADVLTSGALCQGYLACAALLVLPLGVATARNAALLDRITADGRLFRRNFTESLVGMAFLEPAPGGRDLVVVDLNETALGILGGTEEEVLGAGLRDLVALPATYDAALPGLLSGRTDGWRTEGPLAGPRPGRVTVQVSALGESGETPFFAAQLLDVTAEYDARHGLEAAQQLTAATLDTTNCIIMVTDTEGVVVRVNAATTALTGYSERELLGRPVWETGIAPDGAGEVSALFLWPNRSGVPAVRESDVVTRDGRRLRIVWNTSIVTGEAGQAAYAVMTGIDVTAERATAGLVTQLMEASLSTAIVGIDTAGRISVTSSGVAHLLGYDRDELVGQPFHRLLEPTELLQRTGSSSPDEAFDILIRGLGRDGETRARDWTWLTRSGGRQVVSMTISVAADPLAAQTGYLCVGRDVTEQRHSQEMLIAALDKERAAVERLRALDRAKNEFVSTVSHELRTPVTSIVGYTEMLQDGSVVTPVADQLPLLETITRNGLRLIAMINDLLMLSGLDSETVQWRHDPVDLATTLGPVEDAIRPLLKNRSLTLRVERPTAAVPVLGDRAQLERVLINLLSNAVKFTEDGGEVTFSLDVDHLAGQAVVTVADTGIGIPVDEQADLFQRFFRSSTAQVRQIQGTGLGLSIVAAIVAGHGGTIEVDSAHMEGSRFTVTLPLARAGERLTPAG